MFHVERRAAIDAECFAVSDRHAASSDSTLDAKELFRDGSVRIEAARSEQLTQRNNSLCGAAESASVDSTPGEGGIGE